MSPLDHPKEDLDGAEVAVAGSKGVQWEDRDEEVTASDIEEEEARLVKRPHDPGNPTRKDLEEHLPLHWPFRPWCRHCVQGRGVASPHKSRSDEDTEFSQGRIPTVSLVHCFLGSARSEDMAHVPFSKDRAIHHGAGLKLCREIHARGQAKHNSELVRPVAIP